MPESKLTLDVGYEATGARVITLRNLQSPKVASDQSLGLKFTWNSHPRLPQILDSEVIILAVEWPIQDVF